MYADTKPATAEEESLMGVLEGTGMNLGEAFQALDQIEAQLFGPTPTQAQANPVASPNGIFGTASRQRDGVYILADRLRTIARRLSN